MGYALSGMERTVIEMVVVVVGLAEIIRISNV